MGVVAGAFMHEVAHVLPLSLAAVVKGTSTRNQHPPLNTRECLPQLLSRPGLTWFFNGLAGTLVSTSGAGESTLGCREPHPRASAARMRGARTVRVPPRWAGGASLGRPARSISHRIRRLPRMGALLLPRDRTSRPR
jgi:hypothetical protein